MARLKRKLYYTLEVEGKWWCYTTKNWVDNLINSGTSTREFKYKNKAMKEFNKVTEGAILRRFKISKKEGQVFLLDEWSK